MTRFVVLVDFKLVAWNKRYTAPGQDRCSEEINSYGIFISIADDSLSEQLRMANGRLTYLSDESDVHSPHISFLPQERDAREELIQKIHNA